MVRWESTLTALVGAAIGVAFGLGLGGLVAVLFGDEGFSFAVPTGMLDGDRGRRGHRRRDRGGAARHGARHGWTCCTR